MFLSIGFDEPTGAQVPSMFLNFIGSSIDWGYLTEPEPAACLSEKDRKCYWPRGKVRQPNIHTYPRRRRRGITDIPARHPYFTKIT
jgi:hypothetical protein